MTAEIIALDDHRPSPEEKPSWPQVRWLRAAGKNDQLPTHSDDGRCLANAKTMRACEWRGWVRREPYRVPEQLSDGTVIMCERDRWFVTAAGRQVATMEVRR